MSRSKKIRSTIKEPDTPSWLDRILKEVEKTFTPLAKDIEKMERAGIKYVPARPKPSGTEKTMAVIQFIVAAIGTCFAVVNAIFLSSLDVECKGYEESEKTYLFTASIIVAVLFGILSITTIYNLKQVYQ